MAIKAQALTITYFALDTMLSSGKTGDNANHTLKVIKDGVAGSPANAPAEVDAVNTPGVYRLALTAAEMTADTVMVAGKSSSSGVLIIPSSVVTEGGMIAALRLLSGAYTVTVQFYRTATVTPIPDVLCDVYDSTETARLNGVQLKADVNGQISFARDNGTYKVRAMLAGFTFTTGTVIVNGANITLTMYGAAIAIPNPPVAGTQTLFGNVRELDWGVSTGDTITAVIADKGQVVNGTLIQHLNLSTTVDANSQFSLTVPKGAVIRLTVKDHGTHEITINQEDTYDVATYLTG